MVQGLEEMHVEMNWKKKIKKLRAATQYAQTHANELANHVLAVESDSGYDGFIITKIQIWIPLFSERNFDPYGFGFTGSDKARAILQSILTTYMQSINTTFLDTGGW